MKKIILRSIGGFPTAVRRNVHIRGIYEADCERNVPRIEEAVKLKPGGYMLAQ